MLHQRRRRLGRGRLQRAGAFTHTCWNDHEIVVANLFDGKPRRIGDRIPCYGLFIDPALGRVGMRQTEILASEAGETQGFMEVPVEADTQRIMSAAILGMNGDEAVHSLLDSIAAVQPYTIISRAMHIHPTVSELVPTLLQQLKPA